MELTFIKLNLIKRANTYLDKKSIEDSHLPPKPKYKLVANKIKHLNIYIFFIVTTNKSACKKECTLCAYQQDWENKNKYFLKAKYSYIDVSRPESLDKNEIIKKIRDKDNSFRFVAKLCKEKFEKLKNLYAEIRKRPGQYPIGTLKTLNLAFNEFINEKIKDLGLD